MTKIKVLGKSLKKEGNTKGKDWKIHAYKIDENTWVDSFDNLEVGKEYEGEIQEPSNPSYNSHFKLSKETASANVSTNGDLTLVNQKLDKIIEKLFTPDEQDDLPF